MFGCFVGCVLYADDILLISGSVLKLQKMLNICSEYAKNNDFMFNSKKSACIAFGEEYSVEGVKRMTIGTEHMEWVEKLGYLGVTLVAGKIFTTNSNVNRRKFLVHLMILFCMAALYRQSA